MTEPAGMTAGLEDVQAVMDIYRITDDDLSHVRAFGKAIAPVMEEGIDSWYAWLRTQPDFDLFFSEADTLKRVQKLQREYWNDFMAANVDEQYVAARRRLGETHARIGLPLNTYFAGMNMFLVIFFELLQRTELPPTDREAMMSSIAKLLHFDTAIVVDTYNRLVENTLTAQAKSLMEMSTPVAEIMAGILLLPLVGLIDSKRAQDVMNATLAKISETQAGMFILDISGVGVVDTAVANHLIKITKATRLMGCEATISGVSPAIAQTIVELGIDVGTVRTTSTLRDALAGALDQAGKATSKSV